LCTLGRLIFFTDHMSYSDYRGYPQMAIKAVCNKVQVLEERDTVLMRVNMKEAGDYFGEV